MKIGGLKKRADSLAQDAWTERRKYKNHADASLSIVRKRLGSPASLAISFSIGFIAGSSGSDRGTRDGADEGREAATRRKGFARRLAEGPIGDSAIKLASGLLAGSLVKVIDTRNSSRQWSGKAGATEDGSAEDLNT